MIGLKHASGIPKSTFISKWNVIFMVIWASTIKCTCKWNKNILSRNNFGATNLRFRKLCVWITGIMQDLFLTMNKFQHSTISFVYLLMVKTCVKGITTLGIRRIGKNNINRTKESLIVFIEYIWLSIFVSLKIDEAFLS